MNKFKQTWNSFDNLGASSTLNYKGSDSYKTSVGALFTIVIQVFTLIVGFIAVNGVLDYEDP